VPCPSAGGGSSSTSQVQSADLLLRGERWTGGGG
jgi:hypothetical protein